MKTMSARPPARTFSTSSICVAVAAQQPVLAEDPHVAGHRDRGLRRLRHGVIVGRCRRRLPPGRASRSLDSSSVNPTRSRLKPSSSSAASLDAQHLLVPSGVECQPVVGQHQRAPLRFGQVIEDDDRDLGHPQLACGQQAGVAGDDDAVGADEDRIRPPELGDRWPRSGRPARHYACAHSGRRESASRPATSPPAGSSCVVGLSGFLEQAQRVVQIDDLGDHRHDHGDQLVPTELLRRGPCSPS